MEPVASKPKSTAEAGVEMNKSAEDRNMGVVEALTKFPSNTPTNANGAMKIAFLNNNFQRVWKSNVRNCVLSSSFYFERTRKSIGILPHSQGWRLGMSPSCCFAMTQ